MQLDILDQSKVSVFRLRKVEDLTLRELVRGDPEKIREIQDGQGVVWKEMLMMMIEIRWYSLYERHV